MSTFNKLKVVRSLLSHLPGIKTYKDFDIAMEIGFHQERGKPICVKELLLLNIASAATVRRHLARLVKAGTIIRHVSQDDGRSIRFTLSKSATNSMDHCLKQIIQALANR